MGLQTIDKLVCGFNPFEKYARQIGSFLGRDENKKYLKPPPRYYPKHSMYGIFTYLNGSFLMVNVGKLTIHALSVGMNILDLTPQAITVTTRMIFFTCLGSRICHDCILHVG